MTKILRLDSSVSGDASVTNGLSSLLVETLDARHGDVAVTTRDVTALPSLSSDRFAANSSPTTDRSDAQAELAALGDELIAELVAADVIIVGAPIYNFGVPSGIKAWMDLVARAGATFKYTETGPVGLLEGKQAYVVSASGGVPIGSEADFATPHLTLFLNFLGIADVTVVGAGGLNMDPSTLRQAEDTIRSLVAA